MVFIGGVDTDAKFSNILDGLGFKGGDITDEDNSNTIYDYSEGHVPLDILQNDSITLSAGDGLSSDASVSLGGTLNFSVSPSDFAGSFLTTSGTPTNINVNLAQGLESDGNATPGIRVRADELASNGLVEGSNPYELDIDPSSVAGSFMSEDGSSNFQVDIGSGLEGDGSGNIRPSAGTIAGSGLEEGINPYEIKLSNDSVSITANDGLSLGNLTLGNSATLEISGNLSLDSDLEAVNGETIWDENNSEIPDSALGTIANSTLNNDGVTVTANNGLSLGNFSLGDSITLGISGNLSLDSDLESTTGTTIWDEANDYIPISTFESNTFEIVAGDGLKNGSSASLGSSVTIDVEPADFAGTFLSDDGSDDLQVDIGDGLEDDGSGNIRVRADQVAGSGLSEGGNPYEVDLTNDSFTVTAGDGLSGGGSVSLGNSTSLSINVSDFAGSGLQDDGTGDLEITGGTGGIDLGDDEEGTFGTNDDFSIRYDSSADDIRWEDQGTSDRMALDRTSGDLTIDGKFTEGAAL